MSNKATFQVSRITIADADYRMSLYQVDEDYLVSISNFDPGAAIARWTGPDKDLTIAKCIKLAEENIAAAKLNPPELSVPKTEIVDRIVLVEVDETRRELSLADFRALPPQKLMMSILTRQLQFFNPEGHAICCEKAIAYLRFAKQHRHSAA